MAWSVVGAAQIRVSANSGPSLDETFRTGISKFNTYTKDCANIYSLSLRFYKEEFVQTRKREIVLKMLP